MVAYKLSQFLFYILEAHIKYLPQLARTCSPCVTRINRAIILVLQTMHGIGIPRKQERAGDSNLQIFRLIFQYFCRLQTKRVVQKAGCSKIGVKEVVEVAALFL